MKQRWMCDGNVVSLGTHAYYHIIRVLIFTTSTPTVQEVGYCCSAEHHTIREKTIMLVMGISEGGISYHQGLHLSQIYTRCLGGWLLLLCWTPCYKIREKTTMLVYGHIWGRGSQCCISWYTWLLSCHQGLHLSHIYTRCLGSWLLLLCWTPCYKIREKTTMLVCGHIPHPCLGSWLLLLCWTPCYKRKTTMLVYGHIWGRGSQCCISWYTWLLSYHQGLHLSHIYTCCLGSWLLLLCWTPCYKIREKTTMLVYGHIWGRGISVLYLLVHMPTIMSSGSSSFPHLHPLSRRLVTAARLNTILKVRRDNYYTYCNNIFCSIRSGWGVLAYQNIQDVPL